MYVVLLIKVAFFRKCNLQISKKIYSKKLSWAWNLNLLLTIIGGKLKSKAQDSFMEYFF